LGTRYNGMLLLFCRSPCLPSLMWTNSDKQDVGQVKAATSLWCAKFSAALQFRDPLERAAGSTR